MNWYSIINRKIPNVFWALFPTYCLKYFTCVILLHLKSQSYVLGTIFLKGDWGTERSDKLSQGHVASELPSWGPGITCPLWMSKAALRVLHDRYVHAVTTIPEEENPGQAPENNLFKCVCISGQFSPSTLPGSHCWRIKSKSLNPASSRSPSLLARPLLWPSCSHSAAFPKHSRSCWIPLCPSPILAQATDGSPELPE